MAYQNPSEIVKVFAYSAQLKNNFSISRLLVYSLLGGAFIGLGGLLAIMVAGGMPGIAAENPGLVKLMFGAVFPLGLFLVVLGGAELFTSDCAVLSLSVFRRELKLKHLAKMWTIVFLGNFAGALMIAYLFAYQSGILSSEPWLQTSINIGEAKTSAPFIKTFIKGIGANWLVCMAVWMSYAAKDVSGKILAIWFPIMAFVVMGFEHSIANMFFLPVSMLLGADISIATFLIKNLIPTTLGNIVGGVICVALAYHYMFSKQRIGKNDNIIENSNYKEEFPKLEHLN